jgi:stage V sporulation protein S
METLKVSSTSDPGAAAGAVANGVREKGQVEIQVIGPRAVNQAVKAIAIARSYVAASGVDLFFTPSFASVHIEDQEKTALRFDVRSRHPVLPKALGEPDAPQPVEGLG